MPSETGGRERQEGCRLKLGSCKEKEMTEWMALRQLSMVYSWFLFPCAPAGFMIVFIGFTVVV